MFIANKEFLNYLPIKEENGVVKSIEIREITDFSKKIGNSKRTVDVFFEDKIVDTSRGNSNQVGVFEEDFYKWFDYELVTLKMMAILLIFI